MDKLVVLYTMKSCPHCHDFKDMLDDEGIDFLDRDIDDYKDVPSFMTIESPDSKKPKTKLYAPERDFDELEEGVKIIKEFLEN